MKSKGKITLIEVGPRDGLQNEKSTISVEDKIEFIRLLADSGLPEIEIGAFVSPKWVPQMASSEEIARHYRGANHPVYSFLVPNEKGMELAIENGVQKIAVFTSASDSFNRKNINCSIEESFQRFAPVFKMASEHKIAVRAYVSTAFVCPYEDQIAPQVTADIIQRLADLGITDISIGDTIGKALPHQVETLLELILAKIPVQYLAMHFHDTYGLGLVNVMQSLKMGITRFDSSAGGLGGCPYAPGASGNLATNDLVYLLEGEGYTTGVQLQSLQRATDFIQEKIARPLPSRVFHARPS